VRAAQPGLWTEQLTPSAGEPEAGLGEGAEADRAERAADFGKAAELRYGKNPDRGPLLIISGEKDNTAPWAIANASFKRQKRNQAVTEIIEMPNRGHGLVIDSGWREVADTALGFVKRFV